MSLDASQCVHCGLCLSACPTYQVTGLEVESPRGRLVLLDQWTSDLRARNSETTTWLDDCLDCRACESVCPAHVPTGHLVEAWRTANDAASPPRPFWRALTWFLGTPRGLRWFQRLSLGSQSLGGRWLMHHVGKRLAPSLASLSQGLPRFPRSAQLSRDTIASDAPGAHAAMLFVGCVMDAVYSHTNQHTADLARLGGWTIVVPQDQRCCGALHRHAGQTAPARQWIQRNIEVFESSGAECVVVNAAGCGSALREAPDLFPDNPEWAARAIRFANAIVDATVLLAQSPLPQLPPRHDVIAVHDACHHVHAQHIVSEPRQLLAQAGYRIHEMANATQCCGSAGVYNLTHPAMSQALLEAKLNGVPEDVRVLSAANPGCTLQIQAGARLSRRDLTVQHPIDLAWQAYREARHIPAQSEASQ